jgi:hypothetical protein
MYMHIRVIHTSSILHNPLCGLPLPYIGRGVNKAVFNRFDAVYKACQTRIGSYMPPVPARGLSRIQTNT